MCFQRRISVEASGDGLRLSHFHMQKAEKTWTSMYRENKVPEKHFHDKMAY
jgi:hypothetical protein